jgi:hypothetical protein
MELRAAMRLSPVYGWFTEGLDTQDLNDSGTLLDELLDDVGLWLRSLKNFSGPGRLGASGLSIALDTAPMASARLGACPLSPASLSLEADATVTSIPNWAKTASRNLNGEVRKRHANRYPHLLAGHLCNARRTSTAAESLLACPPRAVERLNLALVIEREA